MKNYWVNYQFIEEVIILSKQTVFSNGFFDPSHRQHDNSRCVLLEISANILFIFWDFENKIHVKRKQGFVQKKKWRIGRRNKK